jgi:hypothetical protein
MAEEQKSDKSIEKSNDYCERPVRQEILIEKMERPEPWPAPPPPQRSEKGNDE